MGSAHYDRAGRRTEAWGPCDGDGGASRTRLWPRLVGARETRRFPRRHMICVVEVCDCDEDLQTSFVFLPEQADAREMLKKIA